MLVILGMTAAVVVAAFVGHLTLSPIQKSAVRANQPVQFFMTDFAWLLVQLQVVMALVVRYDFGAVWAWRLVFGFAAAALVAMWWGAVRALSQAGVRGGLRRAVFILVLLPGVESLMIAAALFYGLAPVFAYKSFYELEGFALRQDPARTVMLTVGAVILATAVVALCCLALRWLSRWILLESPVNDESFALSKIEHQAKQALP